MTRSDRRPTRRPAAGGTATVEPRDGDGTATVESRDGDGTATVALDANRRVTRQGDRPALVAPATTDVPGMVHP